MTAKDLEDYVGCVDSFNPICTGGFELFLSTGDVTFLEIFPGLTETRLGKEGQLNPPDRMKTSY